MANLEGMPIGSLPEATSIQDEDEIIVYRPSTGKAYQANTDLIDSLTGDSVKKFRFSSITIDDFLAGVSVLSSNEPSVFSVAGTAVSTLIQNDTYTARSAGIITRVGNTYDYILFAPAAFNYIYFGRISSDGTITACRRIQGTSVL